MSGEAQWPVCNTYNNKDFYSGCVLFKMCAQPPDINTFIQIYKPVSHENLLYVDISEEKYQSLFENFKDKLAITKEQSDKMEKATRGQASNSNWTMLHTHIVTTSRFGSIAKQRPTTPPDNLLKQMRGYITLSPHIQSLSWGRRKESKAIREYGVEHHKQCGPCVMVENRGLFVNPKYPFLGTSIDGLIKCQKCGWGILEIKCPWSIRNLTPEDGLDVPKYEYCCEMKDGQLKLKQNHNYMYQVQGGMALYEVDWADFVIWTRKGLHVERINFDKHMWLEMLPKLEVFYTKAFVPEIFSNKVKTGLPLYD